MAGYGSHSQKPSHDPSIGRRRFYLGCLINQQISSTVIDLIVFICSTTLNNTRELVCTSSASFVNQEVLDDRWGVAPSRRIHGTHQKSTVPGGLELR